MTSQAPAPPVQDRAAPAQVTPRAVPVWVLPTLVALGLGSWRLTNPQLWRDELDSWDAATRGSGGLARLLGHTDAVSAVYYSLLQGWTSVAGGSAVALRLPSLLAMAATAGLTAAIAVRVADRRTGTVAGLLFASLPVVSRYAQEARGYALTMLAFAAATWLLLDALERDQRRRWVQYAVAIVAMGAFNTVALAAVAGHAVLLRRNADDRMHLHVRYFVAAWTAAIVALSPLLIAGAMQAHGQVGWLGRPGWASGWQTPPQMFMSVAVSIAVLVLAAVAVAVTRGAGATWVATAAAPIALVLVISYVAPTSYWYPRYLMFTVPAWAIAAALASRRLSTAAAVAAVIGVAALSVPAQIDIRSRLAHEYTTYPFADNTPVDYQAVAAVIAQHYRTGDGIAPPRGDADFEQVDVGLRYYLPPNVAMHDVFAARTAQDRGRFAALELRNPTPATVTSKRIWVVGMWDTSDALQSLLPAEAAFLRKYYVRQWSTQPTSVMVVELLTRRPGGAAAGG